VYVDAYLLCWAVLLVGWGFLTYLKGTLALAAAILAIYRITELFLVQMKILLTRHWRFGKGVISYERSALLFLLDYCQLIVGFATVFTVLGQRDAAAFSGPAQLTFGNALYFAVVTMTTTGYGDVLPRSPLAKTATVVAILLSVLLITQMLARAFALTRPMAERPDE
jgi:voltage-gated potassium channel